MRGPWSRDGLWRVLADITFSPGHWSFSLWPLGSLQGSDAEICGWRACALCSLGLADTMHTTWVFRAVQGSETSGAPSVWSCWINKSALHCCTSVQHKAAWKAVSSNRWKWGWVRWKLASGWWWEAGAYPALGDIILSYCISLLWTKARRQEITPQRLLSGTSLLSLHWSYHNSNRVGKDLAFPLPILARPTIGKTQWSIPGRTIVASNVTLWRHSEVRIILFLCLWWYYSCAKRIYCTRTLSD